jgi:predicted phosphodiesterase
MPRIALISDIHSSLPALQAVLRDIEAQKVDKIYCLGDVVGYGPQPMECMKLVMEVSESGKMIAGNHDHAVVHEPIGFNDKARRAALWTNSVVKAGFFSWGSKRKRWKWLRELPTKIVEGDVLYVHASPRDHLEEYLLEEYTRGISFLGEDPQVLLRENFQLVEHTCFVGHTHRPGVITGDDFAWHGLQQLDYRWVIDERKTVINIGSVGQPRDGDCRSCYVIFDGESVQWRRIEYDIAGVQAMIRAIPELDNSLAERLAIGR